MATKRTRRAGPLPKFQPRPPRWICLHCGEVNFSDRLLSRCKRCNSLGTQQPLFPRPPL